MQNRTHAVMAQRSEPADSLDDFPTPPWATRALFRHVLGDLVRPEQTCLEPACGRGDMSRVLEHHFEFVQSSDVADYGYGDIRDFLNQPYGDSQFDWIVTNPPFRRAEQFVSTALNAARFGVAIICRTVFLESVGRYNRLFRDSPPAIFAQFVERVPMVKARLDPTATTATGYCWLVWDKTAVRRKPELKWIPPSRKELERPDDYSGYPRLVSKLTRTQVLGL